MHDLVVVGAGLSGLYAGALAARHGLDVHVVARGLGGLQTGTGAISVHGYHRRRPLARPNLDRFEAGHPYARYGAALPDALDALKSICAGQGLTLIGSAHKNFRLPTALGAPRADCLVPESFAAGDLQSTAPFIIGRIAGFRDFHAGLLVGNLGAPARVLDLPLPGMPLRRAAYAPDIAALFDQPEPRARIVEEWRAVWEAQPGGPPPEARLGVPAILGLRHAAATLAELQETLGCRVFEIPVLPPSVPGMRLFNALRDELRAHKGELTLGPTVTGEVSRHGSARVMATAHERPRRYAARAVLLATGGFTHGGLEADMDGAVRETVFGLDTVYENRRTRWSGSKYLNPHAFARFGVRSDTHGRALDATGAPVADNLWVCGGLLAGADRPTEGSAAGIGLASAYAAVTDIISWLEA